MADFMRECLETIEDEGGYTLHKVAGDAGGETFAGIAKNYHPDWPGWELIYAGKADTRECRDLVHEFYKEKFWDPMKGDEICHQAVARTIYNFGMNSSVRNSVMYAQYCVDVIPDGIMGPVTLGALNALNGLEVELFVSQHALMRLGHRLKRITDRRGQVKFIRGWMKRDLEELERFININHYFGIK